MKHYEQSRREAEEVRRSRAAQNHEVARMQRVWDGDVGDENCQFTIAAEFQVWADTYEQAVAALEGDLIRTAFDYAIEEAPNDEDADR